MKIDVLTLFPEMFAGVLEASILGRAQKASLVNFNIYNLRDWAKDKHHTVDDNPYGGGVGMVLKVDVVDQALAALKATAENSKPYVILLTPQGKSFKQADAQELSQKEHLILVAGHYEGFDERIRSLVDAEISLGDFVLTGGEIPAMAIIDATVRLLPGVLGKDESSNDESFSIGAGLLEYPHYTRPEVYTPTSIKSSDALEVPAILKSGHHAEIEKWRLEQAQKRTQARRPDLIK